MFDIGATELLLVAIVALLVIGPKDLPLAMRTAGQWVSKLRAMTRHFRIGIDSMIREAEVEEQEKIWAEKNAQIMRDHPREAVGEEKKAEAKALPGKSVEKPAEKPGGQPSSEPSVEPSPDDSPPAAASTEPDLFQNQPPADPDGNSSSGGAA